MTSCWSAGELRAYLDGELPPRDMDRVARHLQECGPCGSVCRELAGRAERLSAWMNALPEPPAAPSLPMAPRQAAASRRWAAATALAASVTVGLLLWPGRTAKVGSPRPVPAPTLAAPPPAAQEPATVRPAPRKRAAPAKSQPRIDYFVKLDDEPIDTGLVVRVGLDGGQIPADVIVGPDGRARAIRLVTDFSGEPK